MVLLSRNEPILGKNSKSSCWWKFFRKSFNASWRTSVIRPEQTAGFDFDCCSSHVQFLYPSFHEKISLVLLWFIYVKNKRFIVELKLIIKTSLISVFIYSAVHVVIKHWFLFYFSVAFTYTEYFWFDVDINQKMNISVFYALQSFDVTVHLSLCVEHFCERPIIMRAQKFGSEKVTQVSPDSKQSVSVQNLEQ